LQRTATQWPSRRRGDEDAAGDGAAAERHVVSNERRCSVQR
jgi:hypothetical protein